MQAWRDLSRGGKVTADSEPNRIAVILPDGTRVQYRRDSTSGGPVVEVKVPGSKAVKLHMPKGSPLHELPADALPEGY